MARFLPNSGLLLLVALLLSCQQAQVQAPDEVVEITSTDVSGDALLDSRGEKVPSDFEREPTVPTPPRRHRHSQIQVCNTDGSGGDESSSILAILGKLFPEEYIAPTKHVDLEKHGVPKALVQTAGNLTHALMRFRLPFHDLIADGIFELPPPPASHPHRQYYYQLSVNSAVSAKFYCNWQWSHRLPLRDTFCGCYGGAEAVVDSTDGELWCRSTHVCRAGTNNEKETTGGCSVKIDPFRRACVIFDSPEIAAGASVAPKYGLRVPVLKDSLLWRAASHLLHEGPPSLTNAVQQIPPVVLDAASLLSAYIPTYLACLVSGGLLLFSAEALAESLLFQYAIAALGGGLLGLLWVIFVAIRTTESLLSKSIPAYTRFVSPLLQALYGSSISYVLFNSQVVQRVVIEAVGSFWEHGLFGHKHAGKIFFATSMLVSLLVTCFFRLFRPKTISGAVLQRGVQLVGAMLFFNGTSNTEMSLFFMFPVLLLRDEIAWSVDRLQMEICARTSVAHIQHVSPKDFEAIKKATTARKLAELQQYLQQNPKKTDAYHDTLFAGDRKEQAKNLYRFAHGDLSLGYGISTSSSTSSSSGSGNNSRLSGFGFGFGGRAGAAKGSNSDLASNGDEDDDAMPQQKRRGSFCFRIFFPLAVFCVVTTATAMLALYLQNRGDLQLVKLWLEEQRRKLSVL